MRSLAACSSRATFSAAFTTSWVYSSVIPTALPISRRIEWPAASSWSVLPLSVDDSGITVPVEFGGNIFTSEPDQTAAHSPMDDEFAARFGRPRNDDQARND